MKPGLTSHRGGEHPILEGVGEVDLKADSVNARPLGKARAIHEQDLMEGWGRGRGVKSPADTLREEAGQGVRRK